MTVRRRHVFYLSGFDPQGPSHYHRLYADEAAKQARVADYALRVGPRRRLSEISSTWVVEGEFDGGLAVETQYEFLRWDDIVRAHWPRNRWQVMAGALRSTAAQLGNGVLWRILKTSWPAFLVLALPPALVALLAGWALATALLSAALVSHSWALPAALIALGSAGTWWIFAGWAESKVQMAWLMRSTRFILRQARGETPELERRLDAFAARVGEVASLGDVDEVLVVGHSSGAMLAVSTTARALRLLNGDAEAQQASRSRLSLLTLGECIPMLSYQPAAKAFRGELASLARTPDFSWLDFTAPPDGCCFALVDPVAAAQDAGLQSGESTMNSAWRPPKRLSPRFAQMFDAPAYRTLRRDRYRCHFQYLMAADRVVDYDYYAITAGPQRLADRFAEMPSVEGFRDFECFGGPAR